MIFFRSIWNFIVYNMFFTLMNWISIRMHVYVTTYQPHIIWLLCSPEPIFRFIEKKPQKKLSTRDQVKSNKPNSILYTKLHKVVFCHLKITKCRIVMTKCKNYIFRIFCLAFTITIYFLYINLYWIDDKYLYASNMIRRQLKKINIRSLCHSDNIELIILTNTNQL